MDEKSVSYIVYESAQARAERRDKRMIIALIIVTAMLFISNIAWLYAWTQYDYTSEEHVITLDSTDGGNANYIGHDGGIRNGTSISNPQDADEDQKNRQFKRYTETP